MKRVLLGVVALTMLLLGMPAVVAAPAPAVPAPTGCSRPTGAGHVTCTAVARAGVATPAADTTGVPAGYGPADLRSAYQLPTASSTATVALAVAFDDPSAEADLGVYRAKFGLPPCTTANGCFAKLDQRGGANYPPTNDFWADEVAMDLDTISAVCPTCHLLLVEADGDDTQDIGESVNAAVAHGATSVVDGSSGFEESNESQYDQAYFNHPGVTITAPSGDFGYSNGTAVPYPGVSPNVISVGGTSLHRDPDSPRGWTETAWSSSGSGCSAFEPKPAFQHDPGCPRATAADVSAVADPATGTAAYNTFGRNGGWKVLGGTGGAAALVAAIAALAGTNQPAKAFPYAAVSALNDITSGSSGFCNGSYMCTAGPGYDGPTGLGSPRGLLAFTPPDHHGDVTGTITDATTGRPLTQAAVSADGTTVTSDASGHYDLPLAVGGHDVTATGFGHSARTAHVSVTAQAATRHDFALSAEPSATLSGRVTDGSGHGWPVYAKVTVRGRPGGAVYTDPATGHYEVDVPQDRDETVTITPVYPGYSSRVASVHVGNRDTIADYQLSVDTTTCTAPGYTYRYDGLYQPFDGAVAPSGWTAQDGNGSGVTWRFDDPDHRGNHTGGTGGFAIIDGEQNSVVKDTTLVSAPADLSQNAAPMLGFSTDLANFSGATASVDVSIDGGTSWQNVWQHDDNLRGARVEQIPLPQAAKHGDVRVRFHYTGQFDQWWQVDDVWLGTRSCAPTPGGLVVGRVIDANTGAGQVDGTVAGPSGDATTVATSDDKRMGDGAYWLFAPSGRHAFTATSGRFFQPGKATVDVATNYTTRHDFRLAAGRLAFSTTKVSSTAVLGSSLIRHVTITNTGSAPATVRLSEQPPVPPLSPAAESASTNPAVTVAGDYSPLRTGARSSATATAPNALPDDAAWQPIPHYPLAIMDNAAAYADGTIYSVGGATATGQVVADGYAYHPSTQTWTPIAPMPHARQKPAMAFVSGELVVTGGWDQTGGTVAQTDIYDPATNTWTTGRPVPHAYAAAGVAVLDGLMYVIGGCTDDCGSTDVFVYDPGTDRWTVGTPYPLPVAWQYCGGLAGRLLCAGGLFQISSYTAAYSYDPASGHWSHAADLPIQLWGGAYAAVGGQLVLSGGITPGQHAQVLTAQSFRYDPTGDTWTPLADATYPVFRGGSACGFFKVGGSFGNFNPVANSERLPGFDQCGGTADVPWVRESLNRATLRPGESVTVSIGLDAGAKGITQPGSLSTAIAVVDDTPYDVPDLTARLTVTPPKTWGRVTGVVTGVGCDGTSSPLDGAVVQIDSWAQHVSIITDPTGHYSYWLDRRNNPLTAIVAADTWRPQTRTVQVTPGKTTTSDFALQPVRACH
jgi:hypothetical protein